MREPAARGASIDITELERRLRRPQLAKGSRRDPFQKFERSHCENGRAASVDRYHEIVAEEATHREVSAQRVRRDPSYHRERDAYETKPRCSFDGGVVAQQRRHKAVYQQEVVHRNRKIDRSGAKSAHKGGPRFPKFRYAITSIAVLTVASISWAFTYRSGGGIASQGAATTEVTATEVKRAKTVPTMPVDGVIGDNSALDPVADRQAAAFHTNGAAANATAKPATELRIAATEAPAFDNATAPATRRVGAEFSAVKSNATPPETDVRGSMNNAAKAQSERSTDRMVANPILSGSSLREDRPALSGPLYFSAEKACDLEVGLTNEMRGKCIHEEKQYIEFASERWARLSPKQQTDCNARASQDHFGEHNEILARCVEKALSRP
jgi:hypothetical protein